MHENSEEKISDHLVDFCKRSSINRMVAGSKSSHGVFSPFSNFSNTPYVTFLCRTKSLTDLWHLCCKHIDKSKSMHVIVQYMCSYNFFYILRGQHCEENEILPLSNPIQCTDLEVEVHMPSKG